MESILNKWEREEGKCICCGETLSEEKGFEKPRLSTDDGFCQSSYTIEVCLDCYKPTQLLGESVFRKIGDELFYEYNADFGILHCLSPVRNIEHFEYLKNRTTNEYLEGVKFSDDRFKD